MTENLSYKEALDMLDEPVGDNDYGIKMMGSKSTGKIILKSKYGIVACSRDWPIPFHPTEKDLNAKDYKIITSTSEMYNYGKQDNPLK